MLHVMDSTVIMSLMQTSRGLTAFLAATFMLTSGCWCHGTPAKPRPGKAVPPKTARAKVAQPRTVKDYFLLLPDKYFETSRREVWLDEDCIIDIKNDYIHFPGDGAQSTLEVALFRYRGQVLVAVYDHYMEGSLDFLRYINGRWKNVTRQVIPVPFNGYKYQYKIPRYGTTIRVTANRFDEELPGRVAPEGKGKRAYDLVWTRGKFVVRR
jgi:hypothetical protein